MRAAGGGRPACAPIRRLLPCRPSQRHRSCCSCSAGARHPAVFSWARPGAHGAPFTVERHSSASERCRDRAIPQPHPADRSEQDSSVGRFAAGRVRAAGPPAVVSRRPCHWATTDDQRLAAVLAALGESSGGPFSAALPEFAAVTPSTEARPGRSTESGRQSGPTYCCGATTLLAFSAGVLHLQMGRAQHRFRPSPGRWGTGVGDAWSQSSWPQRCNPRCPGTVPGSGVALCIQPNARGLTSLARQLAGP